MRDLIRIVCNARVFIYIYFIRWQRKKIVIIKFGMFCQYVVVSKRNDLISVFCINFFSCSALVCRQTEWNDSACLPCNGLCQGKRDIFS